MSMEQSSNPEQTTPSAPAAMPQSSVQPVAPQPMAPPTVYQPAPPPAVYGYQPAYVRQTRRDKSTAVLLAVFFSFFTWLYTYEKDSWKFWLNFAVAMVNIVLSFLTVGIWLVVVFPVSFAVWIWAIVDVAAKS